MTEQLSGGNEDEIDTSTESLQESVEVLGRDDRFISGPGDVTFHISAEAAEEIKEKNGGELPEHFRIRED